MARYIGDKEVADFLIKKEGFLDKPTDIGDGKITLGSGLTDPKWHALYKKKGRWSKEDNRNAVLEEVAKRRVWAEDTIPNWEQLPESAQDALLSYKYNYNFTPTNSPSLFEAMREGNFFKAAEEINATSKDPKFRKGLEERRKREQEMFLSDLMPQKTLNHSVYVPYTNNAVSDNTRVTRYPTGEESSQFRTIVPERNYIETTTISPGEKRAQQLRNTFESTRDYNRMMQNISIQNNPQPTFTPQYNYHSEGGSLNSKTWDNLSMAEKSEMMRVAIENGITTLPEIKEAYNQFALGGFEDNKPKFQKSSEAYYDPDSDTIFAPDSTGEYYYHELFHARPDNAYLQKIAPLYSDLNDEKLTQMGADLPFVKRFEGDPGHFYSPAEVGARRAAASYMLKQAGVKSIDGTFLNEARKDELKYGNNFRDLLHMYNNENLLQLDLLGNQFAEGGDIPPIIPFSQKEEVIITPDSNYNSYLNTLPDNQRFTPNNEYDSYFYWKLNGKPKNFNEAHDRRMFTYDTSDHAYHANSIAWGDDGIGYFMKPKTHDTVKYELDWFNKGLVTEEGGKQRPETSEERKNSDIFRHDYELIDDPNRPNFYRYQPVQHSYGGNLFSGEENRSSQMHQGYVYDVLPKMLKEAGLNVRVTSGYRRPGQAGKAGSRSWHTHHGAVDIVPQGKTTFEDIENALYNNPIISRYMRDNGFGLIDESGRTAESKTTMKKTGATGAHFHIGKDSKAVSAYNNKMSALWDSNMNQLETAINQPALPAFMPSNPQAFFAPLESYQRPVVVEEPLVQAAMENPYSPEQLEREERAQGLRNLGLAMSIMRGGQEQSYSPLWSAVSMLSGNQMAKGGKIHIKPENRGKFTALKKRTGHSATWFKQHGTPAQKKMATFALNSKKWKHSLGGHLFGEDARLTFLDFI